MSEEKRAGRRVWFEQVLAARMMGLDGTWQRQCVVDNVSDGGAKLRVNDTIEGLPLQEFILVLSPTGRAYRHCRLVWVNGDRIGVSFLGRKKR
jgi:hypothetical protein